MPDIKTPAGAAAIIGTLAANGFSAYVVGGCVRDSLLGINPNDWDICTDATPDKVKEILPFRTIDTGVQHGTVTVLYDGEPFEVTTFRVEEGYSDNRHPDEVRFVRNIRDDLARRDFTVNAMAYNDTHGLVDEFGGREDLESKVISCVGIPDERFAEDALRILRALRFASTYEFSIAPETAESVHRNRARLSNIAAERIRDELLKLLCGRGAYKILTEFSDVICEIIPELSAVSNGYPRAVASYSGKDSAVNLALLLKDIKDTEITKQVLLRLRLDNKTRLAAEELILHHATPIIPTEKEVKKWLSRIGEERLRELLDLKRAAVTAQSSETMDKELSDFDKALSLIDKIINSGECYSLSSLALDGNALVSLGIPRGREVGKVLSILLEEVISGELENERQVLEERVRKLKKL